VTLRTFERDHVGRKYHVEYPTPKHVENSPHGTRWGHQHGYKTNDFDILPDEVLTKAVKAGQALLRRDQIAGHIPNEHWPEPIRRDGFHDPKGILHRDDHIQSMVPQEWGRLVAHTWVHGARRRFQIVPIEEELRICGDIGMQALIEPKHSPVWYRSEVWAYLASIASYYDCRTAVYSLMHDCLPMARRAGFEAWAI
jgi:hypothetical protein